MVVCSNSAGAAAAVDEPQCNLTEEGFIYSYFNRGRHARPGTEDISLRLQRQGWPRLVVPDLLVFASACRRATAGSRSRGWMFLEPCAAQGTWLSQFRCRSTSREVEALDASQGQPYPLPFPYPQFCLFCLLTPRSSALCGRLFKLSRGSRRR